MSDILEKKRLFYESTWESSYEYFFKIIRRFKLIKGAEIGVAFGGHVETILTNTSVDLLYGVDSYRQLDNYDDPMNLSQNEFDAMYEFALKRLSRFGQRFKLIRDLSTNAVTQIPEPLDFIYIDAIHSYQGVWEDLCAWFPKVRFGGIIGGHDYDHVNFPGVKQAVDEFFRRFSWEINFEGEGVWWIKKEPINISFFMPAYNCRGTIEEAVDSIMESNFREGDELIIVDDGSNDGTDVLLNKIKENYPVIQVINHKRNKGGGAARNAAIEHCSHPILFCLDADNILADESIPKLQTFMENSGADIACFKEVRYFKEDINKCTHSWIYKNGIFTLSDALCNEKFPGASGNYIFTKESFIRAGGYPDYAGALDTWGFGFRQLAKGSKMIPMPGSYYYHRIGHDSYWVRESQGYGKISLTALQIIIPFLHLINEKDVNYIMGSKGRYVWFQNLKKRPLRLKPLEYSSSGYTVKPGKNQLLMKKLGRVIGKILPTGLKNRISWRPY